MAGIKINKRWGYIDKKGNLVIDYQFYDANCFVNGIARVKLNEKYGFIKLKNNGEIKDPEENMYGIEYQLKNRTAQVNLNLDEYIKYESDVNYKSIKFIDLTSPISNDKPWTLP